MKILTIVGARPQFVKAAAVSRAIAADGRIEEVLVHTGQHFDQNMSAVFFEELGIPAPKHTLDINNCGHGEMTGRMLAAIEALLITERPDFVLIYGDTNSTLAGALAAAKLHIPVAHVEAGLRSYNRRMPEEINRVLADHVSTLLFCPTQAAVENLGREGITSGVHHVGDVMYDATLAAITNAQTRRIVAYLGLEAGRYHLATIHRAENTDDPARLQEVLTFLADHSGGLPVVMPVHPRTRAAIARSGLATDRLQVCDPIGYLDMAALLAGAAAVYTDSGGLQKEAYFHRKPCVTLRDETEWVETVAAGWNRLWTNPNYAPRRDISEYGDGKSSERIIELLLAAK